MIAAIQFKDPTQEISSDVNGPLASGGFSTDMSFGMAGDTHLIFTEYLILKLKYFGKCGKEIFIPTLTSIHVPN